MPLSRSVSPSIHGGGEMDERSKTNCKNNKVETR